MDSVTWRDYEEGLAERVGSLHREIHTGAYRAKPSRRVHIPKADGKQRALGIASVEDKVVQQAVVTVLNTIYEEDFLGFSYGFRQGRSQHDALEALTVAIKSRRVNWILDADIAAFFDEIDHDWMLKFLAHRIADQRMLRLIGKWLKAGVFDVAGYFKALGIKLPEPNFLNHVSLDFGVADTSSHYHMPLLVSPWSYSTYRGS